MRAAYSLAQGSVVDTDKITRSSLLKTSLLFVSWSLATNFSAVLKLPKLFAMPIE